MTLFWLALLPVIYSYLGYPLLLALLPRREETEGGAPALPTLLIVPFFNEEKHIARKAAEGTLFDRAILVSDGSTDAGANLARRHMPPGTEVWELGRSGKTAAIAAAVERTEIEGDEIIFLSDANVSVSAEAVSRMKKIFRDPRVGAVSAALLPERKGLERWYWRYENLVKRAEDRALGSIIGCSGACWAIRRRLLENIDYAERLCEDLWIPLVVLSRGYLVRFEADAEVVESDAGGEGIEYRRRRRIMAGNLQVLERLGEIRLPRRYLFSFVSRKLLRWLSPVFLVIAGLALTISTALSGRAIHAALAWILLLIIPPTRYFLFMNLALLSGVIRADARGMWAPER